MRLTLVCGLLLLSTMALANPYGGSGRGGNSGWSKNGNNGNSGWSNDQWNPSQGGNTWNSGGGCKLNWSINLNSPPILDNDQPLYGGNGADNYYHETTGKAETTTSHAETTTT